MLYRGRADVRVEVAEQREEAEPDALRLFEHLVPLKPPFVYT